MINGIKIWQKKIAIDYDKNINILDKNYVVEIPVKEHEAKNIDFRAENRELRISMERRFESTLSEDGSDDKVSKTESYISKIPVDNIIDPKTIEKSYTDGILKFKINFAQTL